MYLLIINKKKKQKKNNERKKLRIIKNNKMKLKAFDNIYRNIFSEKKNKYNRTTTTKKNWLERRHFKT